MNCYFLETVKNSVKKKNSVSKPGKNSVKMLVIFVTTFSNSGPGRKLMLWDLLILNINLSIYIFLHLPSAIVAFIWMLLQNPSGDGLATWLALKPTDGQNQSSGIKTQKRSTGRPPTNWADDVKCMSGNWISTVQDRKQWKHLNEAYLPRMDKKWLIINSEILYFLKERFSLPRTTLVRFGQLDIDSFIAELTSPLWNSASYYSLIVVFELESVKSSLYVQETRHPKPDL